ncbi:MAG: ArsB/NhaD family transporter [Clostridiales bacterium]|nr:ArsB/NhaD family transporter [Clostridiales bacterium]
MEMEQITAVGIFIVVLVAIISEKVHRTVAALGGAVLLITLGIMTLKDSVEAIDFNTIGVLLGMMLFVGVVKCSGLFEYLAIKSAKITKADPWRLMVAFIIITAVLSAFLDNVTTVLLVGPMTITICKMLDVELFPYLMTQILASNIGGTATLIGDPPNIMIGSVADLSFIDFIKMNGSVIIVVLIATIICFKVLYGSKLHVTEIARQKVMALDEGEAIKDIALFRKSLIMIGLVVLAFIMHSALHVESNTIALSAGFIMMLIGRQDIEEVVHSVEWTTILFFIFLFIIVGGMNHVGIISKLAEIIMDVTEGRMVMTMLILLWASAIISSILDNIPFVATMIPILMTMQANGIDVYPLWWSVSLGACLGGNGTLIGASANVVLSGIGSRNGCEITFARFFKIGFPMMLLSIVICTVYLLIIF